MTMCDAEICLWCSHLLTHSPFLGIGELWTLPLQSFWNILKTDVMLVTIVTQFGSFVIGLPWILSNAPASALRMSAGIGAQLCVSGNWQLSLWLDTRDLVSYLFSEVLVFGGCCQVECHSLADLIVISGKQQSQGPEDFLLGREVAGCEVAHRLQQFLISQGLQGLNHGNWKVRSQSSGSDSAVTSLWRTQAFHLCLQWKHTHNRHKCVKT